MRSRVSQRVPFHMGKRARKGAKPNMSIVPEPYRRFFQGRGWGEMFGNEIGVHITLGGGMGRHNM